MILRQSLTDAIRKADAKAIRIIVFRGEDILDIMEGRIDSFLTSKKQLTMHTIDCLIYWNANAGTKFKIEKLQ